MRYQVENLIIKAKMIVDVFKFKVEAIVKTKEQIQAEEIVKYTIEAIQSVKSRAKKALEAGDNIAYSNLMGDLWALEMTLVGSSQTLLKAIEAKDEAIKKVA